MSLLDLSAFYKALDASSRTCAAVGDVKTVGTLSRDLQDALKAGGGDSRCLRRIDAAFSR